MAKFTLHAALPPAEIATRLREHVAPGWAVFSAKPVVGHVGTRFLWLRMRGTALSRNSMQPYLLAWLEESESGTRMGCRFTVHPIVLAFFGLWFAVLVSLLGPLALGLGQATPGWIVPLGTLAGVAATAGIAAVGQHFARGEREKLLEFLHARIGATPSPPGL